MQKGFSRHYSRHQIRVFAAGAALAAAWCLWPVSPAFAVNKINKSAEHVGGELVVKLRGATPGSRVQANAISLLERALGPNAVLDIHPFVTDKAMHTIRIAKDADMAAAIAALTRDASVEYAEPNFIYRAFDDGVPNDTDFGKLWGMHNTGQADDAGQVGTAGSDINVLPLWSKGVTGDSRTLVAVIDTGVDWTHPDLAANIYTNPGEAGANAANGKDDDGNGFIDDVHGWNFAAKTNDSRDDHNHGSHCSGTIGGVGNNATGVAGVNWHVSILPVKFLTAAGSGTLEDAVNAINYATLMKANIMSNSWGGGGFSQALMDSIEAAKNKGILFVAAAGNDSSNNDSTPTYPASYALDNVLAVAAIDNQDKIASFSNYGAKTVHVAAPGVKVYSTAKGGTYTTFSGTSMATPHVAGISALLLSANPNWSYTEIKERLIKTSTPVAGLKHKVVGKGRVNATGAFYNTVPPNSDPDESLWKDVKKPLESDHPYKDNQDLTYTVKVPGAKYVRVVFDKVEVEANYDKVWVQSPAGEQVDEITGSVANYTSEYVQGDTAVIRLKSDESNGAWGFKVSKIQVITDARQVLANQ